MIRVVLVDDQPLVRTGLRRILTARDGFDVVAECTDGDEVEAAVAAHLPDLVIMDVRMKRMGGAEATQRLRTRADSSSRSDADHVRRRRGPVGLAARRSLGLPAEGRAR